LRSGGKEQIKVTADVVAIDPEKASKVPVFPALHETSATHAAELIVTIESARHLPKMDVMGTCDAFCEVEWQGQKYKTTVKKNSYSPDWNETFVFLVENIDILKDKNNSCLSVVVKDWDMISKNDFVGEVVIPADTLQALLEGKQTEKMEDSFAVQKKGAAVIGNDKQPCVLNLKIDLRAVVADKAPPPPPRMVGLGLCLVNRLKSGSIFSDASSTAGRTYVEEIVPGFAAHRSGQFKVSARAHAHTPQGLARTRKSGFLAGRHT
jgi:Ca2+-dependent lipid-binding protein